MAQTPDQPPPAAATGIHSSSQPPTYFVKVGLACSRFTLKGSVRLHRAVLKVFRRVPSGFRRNPVLARQEPMGSTDRSTVPCWCMIDVQTHTGPSGVPTGPPGARRDPTGPRRTPGGTVGPRFIGASPVWAARSSYRRRPGLWLTRRTSGKTHLSHLPLAGSGCA